MHLGKVPPTVAGIGYAFGNNQTGTGLRLDVSEQAGRYGTGKSGDLDSTAKFASEIIMRRALSHNSLSKFRENLMNSRSVNPARAIRMHGQQ